MSRSISGFLVSIFLLFTPRAAGFTNRKPLGSPRCTADANVARISLRAKPSARCDHVRLSMGKSPNEGSRKAIRKANRRGFKFKRTLRMSSTDADDSNDNDGPARTRKRRTKRGKLGLLATKLIRMFWKGVTLPFPMLRELGLKIENVPESQGVGFSVRECMLAITGYLMSGILAFCLFFEKWSIVDALYFSVVTFTTVGYGDVVPKSLAGRIFTCVFGLGGISFLGIAIATLGSNLISAETEAVEAAERASRKRVMHLFEGMPSVLKNVKKRGKNAVKSEVQFKPIPWRKALRATFWKSVPAFTFLFLGGLLMGHLESWDWMSSIYFSIITAGTIGYGDMSPATRNGRIWAIVFIPLAVASAGEVLGNVAANIVDRRQRHMYKFLMGRDVTLEHLMRMDSDKDGQVSQCEYVEFMLLEMGLVSRDQIHELHEQFERLDVTKSGYLDVEDLKLMAELRGAQIVNEQNGESKT